MSPKLSRRNFLKLTGLSIAGLAFRPSFDFGELQDGDQLLRIADTSASVHSQPDENSKIHFRSFLT